MIPLPKSLRALAPLAALLGLVGALVLLARPSELARGVELKTLDWRFRHLSDASRRDPDIVLVMLDQPSLDHFEKDGLSWPWPRSMYAPMLGFLKAGGARAVVFDILFNSASAGGAGEDAAFGKALKDFGPTVLAVNSSGAGDRKSVHLPIPPLSAGARLLGDTTADADFDGVFRRMPMLRWIDGKAYPTLPMAAALLATGKRMEELEPPMTDGRMLVRFHGKSLTSDPRLKTYPAYHIADLILSGASLQEKEKPALDPALFKDKVVFVGMSAAGLLDNHPSPISTVFPGTEIVAAAADNLINHDFLTTAPGWTLWALVLAAMLAALAASRLASQAWAALLVVLGSSATLAAIACLCFTHGLWLDAVAPQLALWLGFAAASAYGYAVEGRQKRYIQAAFSHYLSPEIVRQIADNPEKLALGGERRDVTFYFSDIEGFTTISESLAPDKLRHLMNRYLGEMTETILASGGTLDKYIGDAIMAFWGAPLDCPDHALVACKVALANQKRLAALKPEFDREGYPPVRNRIGLNSGPASIGNMGSTQRFSYTAIGDSVNLASRLEGANKAYGSYILISESTLAAAKDAVEVRELDYVKVKGKNLPIRVYELLGLKGETDPKLVEKARRFEEGLALFRGRKFSEAQAHFAGAMGTYGPDHACENYIERCRHYAVEPPPPDWDGSHALTEK